MTNGASGAYAVVSDALDDTLFVEAGAGTGKTTALVHRIIRLVLSGRSPLANIAAITFTEAAAAELRDRISEAFERLASGEFEAAPVSDLLHEVGEPEIVARADAARAEVDAAAISTLHGFARRLLSEHPFEAGLPPVIEVSDELRSTVAFDERWDKFIDELLADPAFEPALMRALALGLRFPALRSLAAKFNENWDLVAAYGFQPVDQPPVDVDAVLGPLEEAGRLCHLCNRADDKLLAHLDGLSGWQSTLRGSTSDLDRIMALDRKTLACKVGQQQSWGGRIDEVRGLTKQAEDARTELLGEVADAVLRQLFVAIGRFTLEGAEVRRREGRLEYHDLLVWARRLVRESPDARRAIRDQYRYLLVDEFQDTDPIQAELAVRIASDDPDAGTKDWESLHVEPGRLFFVGDPKQSIYRFRRADLSVFLGVRQSLGARYVLFDQNHRSVPGIVAFVNGLFGALIGAGSGMDQPAYQDLDAVRLAQRSFGSTPAVAILKGSPGPEDKISAVRQAEGEAIVAAIRQACDEGWPVGPGERRATLSDITILIPSRTGLPILQDALEAGDIPYRLETSSLVYSSQEVRELLSVLAAIDDPTDDIAIVAALRSALYACGDDDLLAFKLAGGRFDYRRRAPDSLGPDHPVARGLQSLMALHEDAPWMEVSALVERVLVERRALEFALDDRRPRDAWRRLRFVADQARQFADAFGGSLRRYLSWAERQTDEDIRVTEPVLPERDNEAVRVMTIHAAKGLEFPIVVLTGLNTGRMTRPGAQVHFEVDAPQVRLRGILKTIGFKDQHDREQELEDFERLRLLYVAATRAQDHLIVSLHRTAKDKRSHAALVEEHWEAITDSCAVLERRAGPEAAAGAGEQLELVAAQSPVDPAAARGQWVAERTARLSVASVPRTIAATGVAKLGASLEEVRDEVAEALDLAHTDEADRSGWQRGRAGTAIGRAVHGTLQSVDLGTGAGLADLARAQAAGEGVGSEARQVERLARSALDAPLVRAAVQSGRYWRELYVGVPVGTRVLEGFIDLLVETDEGFEVADYKTDQVRDGDDLDAAAARYRLQGAAYAVAIEASLGAPVTGCTFLFLATSGATERRIEDLAAAKEEVRALLGAGA